MINGTPASSSVTAESTLIDQNYANNQVFLGDFDSSFTTYFLDVFTGSGGGAYVQVSNTVVDYGALGIFSPYNINGGGDNTSSLDNISSLTVTVNPVITPVITWNDPFDITYGTALDGTELDATASVPGSFVYTPAAGTVLSAGPGQTLSVTFTPTDTADYNDATATVLINVQQAAPTFSGLTESQTITYGKATIDVAGTLSSATAIPVGQDVTVTINGAATTAEVGADGSFAATIDTATLPASATPYPIAYGYAGDANFQSASDGTTTLTVNAAPLTVTATGESMTYGGTVPA